MTPVMQLHGLRAGSQIWSLVVRDEGYAAGVIGDC
jgi:hypothetical protein